MSGIDNDLELADEWAKNVSPWAKECWRATCKRLANEVRRLRAELADAGHDRDEHRRVAKLLGEELAALRAQEPVARTVADTGDWVADGEGNYIGLIAGAPLDDDTPLYAAPVAQPAVSVPDVDALAQYIREIDGAHKLGACALAEKIVEWLPHHQPEAKP